jgi:hypothetical protein
MRILDTPGAYRQDRDAVSRHFSLIRTIDAHEALLDRWSVQRDR